MNKTRVEIFAPRYVGERFQEHRLPLDLIEDLFALKQITIELAKYLYKQKNPERERIPRNFTHEVSFELESIGSGSTIPCIVLVAENEELFPAPNIEYFENASELFKTIVQVAEEGGNIRELAPMTVLSAFEKLGSKLKDEEYIEFTPQDESRKARLDRSSRRRIIQAASQTGEYTESGVLRGLISEMDLYKHTFNISLVNGRRFSTTYDQLWEEIFLDAFNSFRTSEAKKVCLEGRIKYSASGNVKEIVSIDSVNILESRDVGFRLEEIGLLNKGWYDGEGVGFNTSELNRFHVLFENHFATDLPLPNIFPTPEGQIQLEWSIGDHEASIEVNLQSLEGEFDILDCDSDESEEAHLNLNSEDAWKVVNAKILKLSETV